MPIVIIGPAISGLQSRGFRYIWCDESWQYPKGRLDEAKGRNGDFKKLGIDKSLFTSQGGFTEDLADRQNADWWNQWSSGRLNEWFVRCLSCGEYQLPKWNGKRKDRTRWGIVWDEYRDTRGQWLVEKCLETVRFECQHCAHPHIDGAKTKAEWNRTGEYRVRDGEAWVAPVPEFVSVESLHWPGVITYPWRVLLDEFLKARNIAAQGDRSKTIVFFQKKIAEFHNPKDDDDFDQLSTVELVHEPPPDKPFEFEGILWKHRLMGSDVQYSHFEAVVKAFSDQHDDLTLWAGNKLYTWAELNEARASHGVAPEDMAIDIGHRRDECLRHCAELGEARTDKDGKLKWFSWKAMEGTDVAQFPWTPAPTMSNPRPEPILLPYSHPPKRWDPTIGLKKTDPGYVALRGKKVMVIRWSNPWIKDIVQNRFDGRAKGVKSLHLQGDWNEEFNRHMRSELKVQETRGNKSFARWIWQQIGKRPNHLRDAVCMIYVRAHMKGLLGDGTTEVSRGLHAG